MSMRKFRSMHAAVLAAGLAAGMLVSGVQMAAAAPAQPVRSDYCTYIDGWNPDPTAGVTFGLDTMNPGEVVTVRALNVDGSAYASAIKVEVFDASSLLLWSSNTTGAVSYTVKAGDFRFQAGVEGGTLLVWDLTCAAAPASPGGNNGHHNGYGNGNGKHNGGPASAKEDRHEQGRRGGRR